ncbi:MAG TPA: DUF501 domain-containing protein [Mycobacteriales bacterium]|nr:DUF501 domain-containing protein [Mycobacteriales bacterium]
MDETVRAVVEAQLGRPPRAIRAVAHRCSCGLPDVIETNPVLADGTPFPTLYYLTCPRAAGAIGRLESEGMMRDMNARLADDQKSDGELARRYAAADAAYRDRRTALGGRPDMPTAGGMPVRVKCLHALVAHSLAAGPGVNPFGDEALAVLDDWGARGPCVDLSAEGPA